MKKFIITIDTEGDNQWEWKDGAKINTRNVTFLPRFQHLSNEYGFKPVWMTNYEMVQEKKYIEFIADVIGSGSGEIGMHLHAWSTPPDFKLPLDENGAPYLIEYPIDIMEAKIAKMTEVIASNVGIKPVSHRAGRWAMDDRYFALLSKYGYTVDCSVTPHKNWIASKGQTKDFVGSDYSSYPEDPWIIQNTNNLVEIPVTIRNSHKIFLPKNISIKGAARACYKAYKGQLLWLRPNGHNLTEMLYLVDLIKNSKSDYIMFMLHSSELMPGGSPRFKNEKDIENLYCDIRELFKYASKYFEGITLQDYAKRILKKD